MRRGFGLGVDIWKNNVTLSKLYRRAKRDTKCMTIQELGLTRNLRVVEEAWVEALTEKSIEEFLKKHSEDVVVYDPTLPGPLKGQSALRELVEGLYRMFPDYQVKKVRSFGQDE